MTSYNRYNKLMNIMLLSYCIRMQRDVGLSNIYALMSWKSSFCILCACAVTVVWRQCDIICAVTVVWRHYDILCACTVTGCDVIMPIAVHQISFRGLAGSVFICTVISLVLYVIAFATNFWLESRLYNYGLWETCTCSDGSIREGKNPVFAHVLW